ncbi:MAG: hypothetical protein OXK17_08200 [Thaumarchaeota archaeon]|nr:hypothetical protein [Nitrososphaerota archaeon]
MSCPLEQPHPKCARLTAAMLVAAALCAVAAASTLAVHAQADDLVVRWSVEGQPPPQTESGSVVGGSDNGDVTVVIERNTGDDTGGGPVRDDTGALPLPGLEQEFKYDMFVTGNQYSVGDYRISIFSAEGQLLNQIIIDQQDLQAESFRHKIKYYDRFSDGYVEIAEALLDPIGEQMYLIAGSAYDYPINSNLEIFVLERGYSLDNLQAIPNEIFSPMEFTFGRGLLEESALTGEGAGDLRAYSPNYMVFDESRLESKMIESLSGQASEVVGQVLLAPAEPELEHELYSLSSPEPSPLGTDESRQAQHPIPIISGLFDDRQQPRFEDAGRVRAGLDGLDAVVPPPSTPALDGDGLPAAALAASAAAALAALGYVMWRMLQRRDRAASEPLPLLASVDNAQSEASYDYRGLAGQMLSRARSLYDAGRGKEAHEALGHAIRLFYARRAGLRGRPTNEELLARMRQESDSSRAEYEAVRRWLAICGSVEYARYRPDSRRFNDALDEFSGVLAESAED